MLAIGLTGGIASGKSTASQFFQAQGIHVIDADIIARELVKPGQAALKQIVDSFGKDILDDKHQLNRTKLRDIVFNDQESRHKLEAILHPLIRAEMRKRLKTIDAPYCVLAIPLLVETGQTSLVDRVLVIDTDTELQIRRLRRRDGLDDRTIAAMLKAQATREQRLAIADDVISNNGSLDDFEHQLRKLHRRYLQLAD
jgi:dephospho-CoA kinase